MAASIFAERWAKGCQRFRFAIIAFWVMISVLGYLYGLQFLDHTVSDFPAPKGSPSYDATLQLNHYFPELENVATESLLLQASSGQSITEGTLGQQLGQFYEDYQSSVSHAYPTVLKGPIVAYYPLANLMPALAAPLVSVDRTATIFVIGYDPTGSDAARSTFLAFLLSEARRLLTAQGLQDHVTVGVTGLGSFGEDVLQGIKTDAARMDSTVLPLALLVMALVVHSLPLMIVPILTMPVTLLAQFLVMYPVACHVDVVSFAPSLMMSLTIAMGIDYNLFQATRFMDGVRAKLDLMSAVTLMLHSAGYIILVSGSTLCVSFLGLLFLPMEILRSLGLGAAVSILMALVVNLSLVPALLFSMGPYILRAHHALSSCFFSSLKRLRGGRGREDGGGSREKYGGALGEGSGADVPLMEDGEGAGGEDERRTSVTDDGPHEYLHTLDDERHLDESCWLGLARLVVNKKWGLLILVAVLGLAVPVMLQVLHVQPSVEFDLMLPYNSGSYVTLHAISDKFGGPGVVFPYRLIMALDSPPPEADAPGILSESSYDAMTHTLQQLTERLPFTTLSDFIGVAAVGGAFVTYADMQAALNSSSFDPYYLTLRTLATTLVSSNQQATYATLSPGLDPYSPKGQNWIKSAREVLSSIESETGLHLYLEGGGATIFDAVGSVLKVFPVMISITLTIVFVLIGLAFQSIVAPLRSVLSVSLTLSFVYGLTVLVYQGGAFEFLGARSVSQVGAVAWLPMVICFSVIVGLALDYDIFLISTVLERRLEGHTDRSALVRGMVSTGHIITAAGIIMAVAFSGLLFSSELALNQTAFLLVASVLLDTFVVRSFLVPILMTLTGRYTWWPRRDLPPPTKDYHL